MDNMLVAHYRQLAAAALVAFASSAPVDAEPFKVEAETIQNISERLHECWVPPVQNSTQAWRSRSVYLLSRTVSF